MSIAASLIPEFDHEMAGTRRVLERVPTTHANWQPHEKSMSLARLATHIAELPRMIPSIVHDEALDLFPPGGEPFERQTPLAPNELLSFFDENVAEARALLGAATDEQLMRPWTLAGAGHTIFTLPKVAAYRGAVINHLIHHRGQLTVYLRLTGTPVPGLYGPSADER